MPERFLVPQFIDTEDKIWGPITVRQFIIILVGLLFGFISYKVSDFSLFIFSSVIIAFLIGIIGFYKVNGAPFHIFALNFIETTFKKPALRIWHKEHIRMEEYNSKEDREVKEGLERIYEKL